MGRGSKPEASPASTPGDDGRRAPVTIRDVARDAGVAIATVSRVLNHNGYASDEVRETVENAAARLNYRPSRRAQSLRRSTSMTIAAIVPELVNPVYLEFLRGVQRTAETRGYVVLIGETQRSTEQERRLVNRLVEEGIDGVVLGGPLAADDAEILRDHGIAMMPDRDRTSRAYERGWQTAEAEATRTMTERLIALGHRRVAAIATRTPVWSQGLGYRRARTDVIRRELRHQEAAFTLIPIDPRSQAADCRARIGEILDQSPAPTAFIACSHPVAPPILAALRDLGVRIPADASLVAYGDSDWAAVHEPALAVVRHDTFSEATWFTDCLLDLIQGVDTEAPRPVITAEFLERESLAVAR